MRIPALLAALALPAAATNVIFIMADDLGYMDTGFNNPESFYETPNLNAFAKEGLRFTAAYAACPVCSPTRSSILTGQYPARTRNTDYFGGPNEFQELPKDPTDLKSGNFGHHKNRPILPAPYLGRLAASHTTLAEAFKAKGYATMHAGKWHLGPEGSWPEDHGFDVNVGGHKGGGPYGGKGYFSPYNNPNLPDGPVGEHLPDRLATEVSKFIVAHKDQPFFVYLPFYSVHTPLMAPKDLVEKYERKKAKLGLKAAFSPEPPRENRRSRNTPSTPPWSMPWTRPSARSSRPSLTTASPTTPSSSSFPTTAGSPPPRARPPAISPTAPARAGCMRAASASRSWSAGPKSVKPGATCDTPVTSTDFYPTLLETCGLDPLPAQHKDGTSFARAPARSRRHARAPTAFLALSRIGETRAASRAPPSAMAIGSSSSSIGKRASSSTTSPPIPASNTTSPPKTPPRLAELKAKLDAFLKDTDALMPLPNPDAKPGFKKW